MSYATILTPAGRLLRRSAHKDDRPAVFAAHFALSHACWLVTYPTAGWLGHQAGLALTLTILGLGSAASLAAAIFLWPRSYPAELPHQHADLPADHPHLQAHPAKPGEKAHSHKFVIDDEHHIWPTQG